MSHPLKALMLAGFLSLVAACASVPQGPANSETGAPAPLLPRVVSLAPIKQPVQLTQTVVSESKSETRTFLFRVEVSSQRLVMVALTNVGASLFTLTYEEGGMLDIRQNIPGQLPFDPQYMLSDFQLTYWPAEAVAADLKQRGLDFEQKSDQDRTYRQISRSGQTLVRIDYDNSISWRGSATLCHEDMSYCLKIQTIESTEGEQQG